jgi:DNA-binding PadR family transcriptional regulator
MTHHPAVDYALLGVICRSNAGIHGYRLIRELDRDLGGTWSLNLGEVYRSLERLIADGFVTRVATAADDKRKPCRITTRGQAALESYTASPTQGRQRSGRDELAVKFLSASPEQALELIAAERRTCEEELRRLAARRGRRTPEATSRMTHLLIDAATSRTRARLAWLLETEGALRVREVKPPDTGGARGINHREPPRSVRNGVEHA